MSEQVGTSNQNQGKQKPNFPSIQVDPQAFLPNQIMQFRHTFSGHQLLKVSRLIEFAEYMEPLGLIRYHGDHATPDTDFENAPTTHATGRSIQETLRNMETSRSWVAFHYIERHPEYKKLVDACLDQVQPLAELHERRTFRRAGWIFVTSPGATTPYHMDHEHNFLMQIQGEKRIHVWDSKDRSIVSDLALETFHSKRSLSLVRYTPEIGAKANIFDITPGMGIYMPSTSPHMVQNGKGVSITLSVTYLSEATQKAAIVHTANHMLRRRGIRPSSYGHSPAIDSIKHKVFGPYLRKKGTLLT